MTGGGLVVNCNAGMFELLRMSCHKFFSARKDVNMQEVVDKSGLVETIKYKTGMYTINLYLTTSCFLVNGRGLNHFINSDAKAIMAAIKPDHAETLNEAILHAVNSSLTAHSGNEGDIIGRKLDKAASTNRNPEINDPASNNNDVTIDQNNEVEVYRPNIVDLEKGCTELVNNFRAEIKRGNAIINKCNVEMDKMALEYLENQRRRDGKNT